MTDTFKRAVFGAIAAALVGFVTACQAPPPVVKQTGYRGTGMATVASPQLVAYLKEKNAVPPPPYPLEPSDAPLAGAFYQNVQVLKDVNTDEFNRLMLSITEWVAPVEGCAYCHNTENMASDEHYTKVVARRMLQMTRNINANWSAHVQKTGVTCYTCHRGNHIPKNVWAQVKPEDLRGDFIGAKRGRNDPTDMTGYSTLPTDSLSSYLLGDEPIRVQGASALTTRASAGVAHTEKTYALMTHMSRSLGVNCTFCHNTRHWGGWDESTPQRAVAWHGIRMTRSINLEYIEPLKATFPVVRLGPLGDPYKVNCQTCHQGANKPLLGVSMLPDHPALAGERQEAATVAAPPAAPADAPAPDGAKAKAKKPG